MNLRFWKRKKDEITAPEPKPLTGIEKWELEQAEQKRLKEEIEWAEHIARRKSRIAEIRKELGPKLQELESLERQLQPVHIGMQMQNALANWQQQGQFAYGGLLGQLAPFTALGGLGRRTS